MTTPIVGKAVSDSTGSWMILAEIPTDVVWATMSIAALNTNSGIGKVTIAITTSDTPALSDHVEYGFEVPGDGGTYDRNEFIVMPGEKIMVKTNNVAGIVFRAHGLSKEQVI